MILCGIEMTSPWLVRRAGRVPDIEKEVCPPDPFLPIHTYLHHIPACFLLLPLHTPFLTLLGTLDTWRAPPGVGDLVYLEWSTSKSGIGLQGRKQKAEKPGHGPTEEPRREIFMNTLCVMLYTKHLCTKKKKLLLVPSYKQIKQNSERLWTCLWLQVS
jgi:hypothetical protein